MRNDYIFETPISTSSISTTFETLKQDQLELRLFQVRVALRGSTQHALSLPARNAPCLLLIRGAQTKSLSSSTDPTRLQGSLRALASTIPPRSALTDYHYGDPFELLSLENAGVEALQAYCWNCQARGCFPRMRSEVCTDPFFEPLSAALVLLDSYGMAGSVQYTFIDPATGRPRARACWAAARRASRSAPRCLAAAQTAWSQPHRDLVSSPVRELPGGDQGCGDGLQIPRPGVGGSAERQPAARRTFAPDQQRSEAREGTSRLGLRPGTLRRSQGSCRLRVRRVTG